ncbi:hypothetical protein SEEACDC2_08883 [Salmonella enterica subsp. enterica serovar Agona str. SA-2]|nr:hypothetical protein SEEACDC2_08883 [Salmonella enterica subsp. enterica serovar Agona str. SA-2]
MPLLDIRNLTIEFKTSEGWVKSGRSRQYDIKRR